MQNQPPILTIKMVPAGVELVLAALNKLPRENVDALFQEIAGQAQYQLQELQKQAQDTQAPVTVAEVPSAPAEAAVEAAVGGTD